MYPKKVRELAEISLAKSLGILTITGGLEGLVEGERHITRNSEVVECGVGKSLKQGQGIRFMSIL